MSLTDHLTPDQHAELTAQYVSSKRRTAYQRGGWVRMERTGEQARCYRAEQPIECATPQCQRIILPGRLFTFYPTLPAGRNPRCRICMPFSATWEAEKE